MLSRLTIAEILHFMRSPDADDESYEKAKTELAKRGYIIPDNETREERANREANDSAWRKIPLEEMLGYLTYPLATEEGKQETIKRILYQGYKQEFINEHVNYRNSLDPEDPDLFEQLYNT